MTNPVQPVYFAVLHGHKPGIYNTWAECEQNIKGFQGAVYSSFHSIEQANDFLKQSLVDPAPMESLVGDQLQQSLVRDTTLAPQTCIADPSTLNIIPWSCPDPLPASAESCKNTTSGNEAPKNIKKKTRARRCSGSTQVQIPADQTQIETVNAPMNNNIPLKPSKKKSASQTQSFTVQPSPSPSNQIQPSSSLDTRNSVKNEVKPASSTHEMGKSSMYNKQGSLFLPKRIKRSRSMEKEDDKRKIMTLASIEKLPPIIDTVSNLEDESCDNASAIPSKPWSGSLKGKSTTAIRKLSQNSKNRSIQKNTADIATASTSAFEKDPSTVPPKAAKILKKAKTTKHQPEITIPQPQKDTPRKKESEILENTTITEQMPENNQSDTVQTDTTSIATVMIPLPCPNVTLDTPASNQEPQNDRLTKHDISSFSSPPTTTEVHLSACDDTSVCTSNTIDSLIDDSLTDDIINNIILCANENTQNKQKETPEPQTGVDRLLNRVRTGSIISPSEDDERLAKKDRHDGQDREKALQEMLEYNFFDVIRSTSDESFQKEEYTITKKDAYQEESSSDHIENHCNIIPNGDTSISSIKSSLQQRIIDLEKAKKEANNTIVQVMTWLRECAENNWFTTDGENLTDIDLKEIMSEMVEFRKKLLHA